MLGHVRENSLSFYEDVNFKLQIKIVTNTQCLQSFSKLLVHIQTELLVIQYNNFPCVATASGKEKADFLAEIDMMKKIAEGYNPHIVNMVGCVTLQEPLCLITEFVPFGDLLSFLRSNRKKVNKTLSFLHECLY